LATNDAAQARRTNGVQYETEATFALLPGAAVFGFILVCDVWERFTIHARLDEESQ